MLHDARVLEVLLFLAFFDCDRELVEVQDAVGEGGVSGLVP